MAFLAIKKERRTISSSAFPDNVWLSTKLNFASAFCKLEIKKVPKVCHLFSQLPFDTHFQLKQRMPLLRDGHKNQLQVHPTTISCMLSIHKTKYRNLKILRIFQEIPSSLVLIHQIALRLARSSDRTLKTS